MRKIRMENTNNNLILIVDDNPNNIQVLASIMAEYGYELGIAQNAHEVYQFLESNTPELILLDVEMPDIDGYEVCRTIKANSKYNDIPIIFLTVKSEMEDIVKGFDLGAVDYMTKPFNRQELISRVRTHISLKRSKDELAKKNNELQQALEIKENLELEKDRLTNQIRNHRDQLEKMVEERTKELATANENFVHIVESITDGFIVLDKEWKYIYLNKHQFVPNSLTRDDVLGKCIWEVFPEIVDTIWYSEFHRAMAERISVHFQIPSQYNDNNWYEITAYPFDEGICSFIKDITDKKKYEAEMKRLSGLDLIGQMAAGISHEIRNPMTTVRGFLQLLNTKEECKNFQDYFNLMIEELDRANSIITEFLSMGNTRVSDLAEFDLNSILYDMTPLLYADAANQNNVVELELNEIPVLLLNRNEIRQLILNLFRNGLDAMSHGMVLTISTYTENDTVVLAVKDQGSGIKPDVLEKLGTPFFSTKDNGTGLGLGVCFAIAARHNATIEIQTGSDGTTFFVKFKYD
jgi:DNA-binding response OmpR family regulator/nitrogen-specific signal transduction histidine kinase